jgi:hypothetical protein
MNTSSDSSTSKASQEEIAVRAREIWLSRGSPCDQDVAIWLEAERQLSTSTPTPVATPKNATKAARKGRINLPAKTASSAEKNTVDAKELEDRLEGFGAPPQRSPTAVDLTGNSSV